MTRQRHAYSWCGLILGAVLALGCGGELAVDDIPIAPELDDPAAVDALAEGSRAGVSPASGAATVAGNTLAVAAIQYEAPDYATCADSLCGLERYVEEAARRGAKLVVVPSYALHAATEPAPQIGAVPTSPVAKTMSDLAVAEKVILIFTLWTRENEEKHQTVIAVDETGKVVGRHYKFQLMGDEAARLVPGDSVATSCFDTAAGKVCMIDGADVHCVTVLVTAVHGCADGVVVLRAAVRGEQVQRSPPRVPQVLCVKGDLRIYVRP